MALLAEIRSKYPDATRQLSDYDIASNLADAMGRGIGDVAYDLGLELPKADPKRGVLSAGLSSGTDQAQGLGYSTLSAVGDATGFDGLRDYGLRNARANQFEAEANGRPDLERIEDQSWGSALPYAGYQISKQLPTLAAALTAGALIPEAAIPAFLARGASVVPKVLGGGGLRAGASFAERKAALEAGKDYAGALVGGTLTESTMGVGSMYQESVDSGNPDAFGALALAPVYGAMGAVLPAALRGNVLRGTGMSGNLLSRVGKTAALEGVGEGAVEGVQNEMEMSFNPNITEEEKYSRRLNSVVVGGLLGGTVGSIGGVRGQSAPRNLLETESNDFDTEAAPSQPVLALPNRPDQVMISFPDGSVGTQEQLDDFINTLPEAKRVAARATLMGMNNAALPSASTALAEAAPTQVATGWAFVDPDTQELLPEPKSVVGNGVKKVQAYTITAQARNDGDIDQTTFETLTNQIATTRKIGQFTPKIVEAIETQKTLKASLAELGDNVDPSVATSAALTTAVNTTKSALTPQQQNFLLARIDPANEQKSDAQLAEDFGFTRQNGSKLTKRAKQTLIKNLAKAQGISVGDAELQLNAQIEQIRPKAEAAENLNGLSPAEQPSVIDRAELAENADGSSSLGTIKSVGDSQIGLGGEALMPASYDPNDVTPSVNTQAHAAQERLMAQAALEGDTIWDYIPQTLNVQKIDVDDAAADWMEDLYEGDPVWDDLTPQEQAAVVKVFVAYQDKKLTAQQAVRRQGEIADEARTRRGETTEAPIARGDTQPRLEPQREEALDNGTRETAYSEQPETTVTGLREPAQLLQELTARSSNPVARDYASRIRQGEDVEVEVNKWLDAVTGDETQYSQHSRQISAGTEYLNSRRWIRKPATAEQMGKLQPALDAVKGYGWGKFLDRISSIQIMADAKFPADGGVTLQPDNTYLLFLNPNLLEGKSSDGGEMVPESSLQRVLDHEVTHIADRITRRISDDKNTAFTAAITELEQLFRKGDLVRDLFAYPIKFKNKPDFDYRAEMLAELMSAYKSPILNRVLQRAPLAQQFAKDVDNAIQNGQTRFIGNQSEWNVGSGSGQGSSGLTQEEQSKPDNNGISASEERTIEKILGITGRKPPDYRITVRPEAKDLWKRLGHAVSSVSPKLLTLTQLVEQFGKQITSLKSHANILNEMSAMESRLRQKAHALLETWGTFAAKNKAMNNRMMALMNEATRLGMHPDLEFDSDLNKHLLPKDRVAYNDLRAKYNVLPTEAKSIYQASKQILSDQWQLRKEIFADVVTTAYDSRIADAKKANDAARVQTLTKQRDAEISAHAKEIKNLKGPYFPLMRFGDFIVIGESVELQKVRRALENASDKEYGELAQKAAELEKSSKHYVVEAFESRLDMEKRKAALESTGFGAREKLAETYAQEMRPVTAGALDRINDALTSQFGQKEAAKLKDLMTEMYVGSLPEHHALQRQIKRKGVAGSSTNMLRAFAEAVERDSFYLSRMKYNKDLTSNLFNMKREVRDMGIEEQNVYNNVVDRVSSDYKYEHTPILSSLARFSSIFHLGIAPSFLLTNMTQPWFISLPQLAGTFGLTRSTSAMRTAWTDAARIVKQGKGGTIFNLADMDLDTVKNPLERKMLQRLRDLNKLESNQLLDMGAVANGMSPVQMKAFKGFNWATHHIELVNRISTALAAYRLEKSSNPLMSEEKLTDKAVNMVDLTQLDYSNENAAYFMKPGIGLGKLNKIVFQFRKYQQGMLYLLGRNAKLAIGGDKEARRALGYLMATQLIFAGTVGLPITAPVLLALNAIFIDDDDEDGDAETQMRNHLTDMVGADAARVFWKGLPTALGVDLSNNLGMGGLLKPFPMMAARDITDARTGEDGVKELLFNAAGAPVGMIANIWDGVNLVGEGDVYRGLSRMTPKFVGSFIKAAELSDRGVTTRAGTEVMPSDQFDAWDIAFKAAGFNPTLVSEHYAAQTSKENTSAEIQSIRKALIKEYALAKIGGDDIEEINVQVQEFNAAHSSSKIDYSTLLKAVQTRKGGSKEIDLAGVRFRKSEASLKEIDRFAY